MGDHAEALSTQQKAVLMSERVNGIDHPYTITEYVRKFENLQSLYYLKLSKKKENPTANFHHIFLDSSSSLFIRKRTGIGIS